MKLLKHTSAVLCLFFVLTLTVQASGEGHMCCPLLGPLPAPPPVSSPVAKPTPKSNPETPQNGEEDILTWAADIASGAWQFFVALI